MKKISIITPTFKGREYVPQLTQMIKACAIKTSEIAKVEWIVVNDDPDDNITDIGSDDSFEILIIPTDKNRGIHGARVKGLEAASGEYVVFLDQDDLVPDNWVYSQIKAIGTDNVVVCNQQRNGKEFYERNGRLSLEEVTKKDYILRNNDAFVPGQVLIKRDIVPNLWRKRILTNNCADDYYLWLLLIAQGEKFVVNKGTYFDHIIHGKNESLSVEDAYTSSKEMIEILKEERVLSNEDFEILSQAQERRIWGQLRELRIVKEKMEIMRSLLCLQENHICLADKLIKDAYGKVFVYGADIGKHVYRKFDAEGISISAIIDRDAKWIDVPIKMITVDDLSVENPLIIMTLLDQADKVSEAIYKKYPKAQVVHIRDLLKNAGV